MNFRSFKPQYQRLPALMFAAVVLISGCGISKSTIEAQDIIILYTNDVHCAVRDDIGYAGLAAYKEWCGEKTPYVTLVDCGDALQGDVIGTISQGEYPVEIMNRVGYDYAVLGNHEFDYGMERLSELLEQSNAKYLGCNIRYTGSDQTFLSRLAAYEIVTYGDVKVGLIGVSTPESIVKSVPAYFCDENGNYVYDFCGESGEELYECVQENVDACIEEGADYVVVLAHLGTDEASSPFSSVDLIANTNGIDVLLDGHSHSVISCDVVKNAGGGNVLLSSTGTGLNNIGRLTITADGNIQTGLIGEYPETDSEVLSYIESMEEAYESELDQSIAVTDVPLTISSDSGVRLIRNRETNLGDFCADAYRAVSGAEIALVNGGGIRADLEAGEITYGDILGVHPYGNTLCVAKATGQEIWDALEMASRLTFSDVSDGENAIGENGGFLQVSGLQYTIDTSVESMVEVDAQGNFISCGDNRRVKDVMVLQENGSYTNLEPDKIYTVASHNYLIKEGGDGLNMFMDNELIVDEGMLDYQILMTYLTDHLGGTVGSEYAGPQGRITVE
ncbi:MAG: bifunctional metallophosphatase/5'-nucleotidase [Lachnospiraceae bacterium]|nr:bifunctional metallophosphatase/5'-nucleotidase [Lachnospiraceae bacterium]